MMLLAMSVDLMLFLLFLWLSFWAAKALYNLSALLFWKVRTRKARN